MWEEGGDGVNLLLPGEWDDELEEFLWGQALGATLNWVWVWLMFSLSFLWLIY